MDPVFSLPYSEFAALNLLAEHFKAKAGYSLFVPASRQEKGVDLLLTRRKNGHLASLSFQVKASRTYTPPPPKRESTKRYAYDTWFNTFIVPKEADFFLLFGLFPSDDDRAKKVQASWWASMVLVFTHDEMRKFIANVKTRGGNRDPMFGFSFDTPKHVVLVRGDPHRRMQDYSEFSLSKRIHDIKQALDSRLT